MQALILLFLDSADESRTSLKYVKDIEEPNSRQLIRCCTPTHYMGFIIMQRKKSSPSEKDTLSPFTTTFAHSKMTSIPHSWVCFRSKIGDSRFHKEIR